MRRSWLLIGLLALVPCAPIAVRAEKKHDDPAAKADENQNEGEAPKDVNAESEDIEHDLFGWAMDLGIWTLVVFLLLLLILGKFAWKPMLQGLENREKAIHAALHEAQQARDEVARLRAQFEEKMREADDKARAVLDGARRAAERSAAEKTAEAHKKLRADQDRFQREMALQVEQTQRELQTQVAQLATLIASKAIRRQVNSDDQHQLMDEALAELRQAGDGRRTIARS
jgi:F-type H+-transporting ATPase subunit b